MKFEALVELSRKAEDMNPKACFWVHVRGVWLIFRGAVTP